MRQLGDVIISKNISSQKFVKYRESSRGIICHDGLVLMIYSHYYDDYTFPGGGIENNEDPIIALKRECVEEAGCIVNNIRPFVSTVEHVEIDDDYYLIHTSNFYLCDISAHTELHLCDYEIALGYEAKWISIDEAIKHDEAKKARLLKSDYDGVLVREIRVLKKLLELDI